MSSHDDEKRPEPRISKVPYHRCDDLCVCPLDGKPLIYAPGTGQHACQDIDCPNGHGLAEFRLPTRPHSGRRRDPGGVPPGPYDYAPPSPTPERHESNGPLVLLTVAFVLGAAAITLAVLGVVALIS